MQCMLTRTASCRNKTLHAPVRTSTFVHYLYRILTTIKRTVRDNHVLSDALLETVLTFPRANSEDALGLEQSGRIYPHR